MTIKGKLDDLQPESTHDLSWLRYLGVTPPISTSESSEREKELTVTLMEELHLQNTMDGEEESRARCVYLVARTLSDIFPSHGLTLWASFNPINPF
jgi:hypothetical protein